MSQMFSHECNAMKGWPTPYALDKHVELDVATDAVDEVFGGMVGHMSPAASGKFRLGCLDHAPTTGVAPMPLFVFPNAADFDVSLDENSLLGAPGTVNIVGMSSADAASAAGPVTQRPVLICLVAKGPFELSSTEYLGTPTTGQLLTSPTKAVDATNKGKLKIATNATRVPANTVVCGCVSDGVINSDFIGGPKRLNFWPCFLVSGLGA